MKNVILLIPLLLAVAINIHAQSIGPSTLNAAGKTAVISGDEFEWSVGQMALVSTFTNPSIIVTQGVLQPDDNLPSGVPNYTPLAKQLQVFPNPATSVVNIKYSSQGQGTLSYRLLDMGGKLINTQTINVTQATTTEQVNISELACATYMLEVTVNSGTDAGSISYEIQKLK